MKNYVAIVNVGPFQNGIIVAAGETIPGELLNPVGITLLLGMGVIREATAEDAPPSPNLVIINKSDGVDKDDASKAGEVLAEFGKSKRTKGGN